MPASTASGAPDQPEPLFPQPLLEALARHPDRTAFEHGSRVVRYGELLTMIHGLVERLRAARLGPGRGIAVLTGVTPEGFAANVATHALGCRVAGIRPGWNKPQLASVLGAGGSGGFDAVIGDSSSLTLELVELAGRSSVLSLGPHAAAIDLLPDATDPGRVLDGAQVPVEARPDDIARVNFTSGSTGQPKACARTYSTYSLAYRPDQWAPDLARLIERFQRYLVHNSFSVPVVLTFTARCLITGGTAVIPDEDPRPRMLHALDRHRISGVVMTVPTLHLAVAQLRDDPVDLRHLRALVVTGSQASPDLLAEAVDRLGPVVWQGYGQAESGMISLLTPEDIARHPQSALASVGQPLPEVEISVRDPDDLPVGPSEVGEIWVRSPHVMQGYPDDPQGTSAVFGHDGWLRTRDLGYLDDTTGLLHLTGRSRDIVIVRGEICYAGAVEQVLARHPGVAQAYVVGVPDEQTGEAVHAFIIPTAGHQPPGRDEPGSPDEMTPSGPVHPELQDELAGLIRSELTENHVPRTVSTIREVPVAASGKPDKQALTNLIT